MTDLATMRNRIQDELLNEDLSNSQITYAIKDAIKVYERRAWWFNQKTSVFYTVANQELYTSTTPSDFENIVQIDSMRVGESTSRDPMTAVDNATMDTWQDGSVTGEPTHYSRYANKIRLFPIPSAVYTISMSHIYKLDELSDGSDSNIWTTDCEELIRQSAKRRLALDILQAEDIASRCASLEQDALGSLLAENRRRFPQKTLRTEFPQSGMALHYWNGA